MELIRGLQNLRPKHRGCAVTVGAFDGVHRGHQTVLARLKTRADDLDLPATVIVFEPLPREYFQPLEAPPRITNLRERLEALATTGIDRVLVLPFNKKMRSMSADDFIKTVFVDGLGARYIELGDDFRFGNSREGDFEYARQWGDQYGYEVQRTDTHTLDGKRVSSTWIREALLAGDFALAEHLLGRPFTMTGRVEYGRQLGRTIGCPTANMRIGRLRSPMSGVYAVRVTGAGLANALGVANVGTRPTVSDGTKANLEVHIIDRQVDLYGKRLTVRFIDKVRDEKKFESVDALQAAIANDVAHVRNRFADSTTHL